MLITLKIWFFIFIEDNLWHLADSKLCRLKQERHRIRLAKLKERSRLKLHRTPLVNWKDIVLFDREKHLMKNFIAYLFLLFLLNACMYTQLKFKRPIRADQLSNTHIEKKKTLRNFWSSPSVSNFNIQPYRVYSNYRYPYISYAYIPYNSPSGSYKIYEQNLNVNKLTQELDQYKRNRTVQNVQKVSSPPTAIERKKQKAAWKSRINPQHRKKISATKKERRRKNR